MNAQELINYIATAPKKTPVKLYVKEKSPVDYGAAKVFGAGDKIVFGDWAELAPKHRGHRDRKRPAQQRRAAAGHEGHPRPH